jgi:hypothetical protein
MSSYAFIPGAPFSGSADEVQAELDRIRKSGDLTPEVVVAVARSKRSVLHPLIYDGTTPDEALAKYHLARARQLLKAIVVVNAGGPTTVRANIRVTTEGGRAWESVDLPEARTAEIARIRREMKGLRTRLHDLQVFPNVVLALDEVLDEELVAA